jgi:hypothetical protein
MVFRDDRIVGKYLLGAVQEVLGDAATPEILDAWGAAYGSILRDTPSIRFVNIAFRRPQMGFTAGLVCSENPCPQTK